jgi:signal transduction histidine kinase/GAF domain-containing protein
MNPHRPKAPSPSSFATLARDLLESETLAATAAVVLRNTCERFAADYGLLVYTTTDRNLLWLETYGLTWRKGEGPELTAEDKENPTSWLRHPAQRLVKRCQVLLNNQEFSGSSQAIRRYVDLEGRDRFIFHRMFTDRFESYAAVPLKDNNTVIGEIVLGFASDTDVLKLPKDLRDVALLTATALLRADRETASRSLLSMLSKMELITTSPTEEIPNQLSSLLRDLSNKIGAQGAHLRIVEPEVHATPVETTRARWLAGYGVYSDWARNNLQLVPFNPDSEIRSLLERGEGIYRSHGADGSPHFTLDFLLPLAPPGYWELVGSTIVLPLGNSQSTHNLIYLEMHLQQGMDYSPTRAKFLNAFTEQMGLVLNLAHRVDEQAQRLKLLRGLTQELLRSRHFDGYKNLIVQTSRERLRAEISTIFIYNRRISKLERAAWYPPIAGLEEIDESYELTGNRRGLTGRILDDPSSSILVNDQVQIQQTAVTETLKKYNCLPSAALRTTDKFQSPVRHFLAVPIEGENGKAFGAIRVINKRNPDYSPANPRLQDGGFSKEDRELLETIAGAVASKLSSERRSDRLEILSKALSSIGTASSYTKVAEIMVHSIVADLGYSACSFRTWTTHGLALLHHEGFTTNTLQRVKVSPDRGLIGESIKQRRTLVATDILSQSNERNRGYLNRDFAIRENLRAACSVPILGEPPVVHGAAVIYIRAPQPYEFFDYEVDLLETLATAVSISFSRLAADEEARQATKRLEGLFNILQGLLISQTRDEVLQLVYDDMRNLLAADAIGFFETASLEGEPKGTHWSLKKRLGSELPANSLLLPSDVALQATERPFYFRTDAYGETKNLSRYFSYGYAVCLRSEGDILGGMLLLNRSDPRLRIQDHDRLKLAETVAEQLARTFKDIELAEERARLERAVPAMISVSLASGMVHEINNQADVGVNTLVPLRRELGHSVGLVHRELLGDAITVFERIGALAKEYLNFGRPVKSAVGLRFQFASINKVIGDTLVSMRTDLRRAILTTDLDPSLNRPHAHFDPKFLSLAIGNLVKNATRWIHDGGKIRIRTGVSQDGFQAYIEDWGSGVRLEDREKIFDPFFSTFADGFGLGLTISRFIVQDLHFGTLRLTNNSKPTVFEITLPTGTREDKSDESKHPTGGRQ